MRFAPARAGFVIALAAAGLTIAASPALAAGDDRIVGGETTTIEEWPWQVAVADPPSTGGNGQERWFCGGSLVAPNVVLTAAHCVYDDGFQAPSAFSVITGRTTLSSTAGTEIAAADVLYFVDDGSGPVAQSSTTPASGTQLYDESTSEWDVALLVLSSAAPAPATPISIAGAGERDLWEAGETAFVTGWGDTTGAGTYSDDLNEAQIEIIDDEDCEGAYPGSIYLETMLCAGIYPLGGKDTCQGDSGGPLVVPAGDGTFRLVGDTSWGIGCALPLLPGVYGRVADDPMRSAIATAVAARADGYDVTGDSGESSDQTADAKAPETVFTGGPNRKTRKRKARFNFTSDESGVSFECALDGAAFESCASPHRVRVKRGRHRFAVRATDAAGNVEASPARYRWKVKRRRR